MLPYIYIGTYAMPSYGLCMATGIVVACLVAFFRLRSRGGDADSLLMIAAVALVFGLCCAKISYYVFSYGIGRLFHEIMSGDYSAFSDLGLVFYGGLVGGIIGALIAIKINKYNFNVYANAIIPCIPLGHAFGRIGCLLAGCCYGIPYEGYFAIHSIYMDPGDTLFPIQAVESIFNIILFILLSLYTHKQKNGFILLSLYIVAYSAARFILEFFRGDLIRGIYLGLSSSQWISVLLIVFFLALIMLNHKRLKPIKLIISE